MLITRCFWKTRRPDGTPNLDMDSRPVSSRLIILL